MLLLPSYMLSAHHLSLPDSTLLHKAALFLYDIFNFPGLYRFEIL